ncbi:long-chain-fatty-acid--CoA ligase [Noviherbaspirillum saxi]|uniref:Long-chain-fatty-acid--CoA ligase n=1 Tax=Noviherbaspirillum saxi TaxID=2320863 RepID=A0A3A3FUP8_9BURK|nr:long-chain-fatty-acid--CoA ligase [Noviherbaspirillum saxi]RJF99786.1 long-chain-fatty-acid--CoA ligase [Noviherbaspirillum saxi]
MITQDISDVVRHHAHERPAQIALVFEDRRTTYKELNQRVNQVANGLLALGVKSSERLVLLDTNSDQFYEVWLGAARIGAVVVPMNSRSTQSEAVTVISDCSARVVFAGVAYLPMLEQAKEELSFVEKVIPTGDEFTRWRNSQSATEPSTTSKKNEVCIQLYTSGTTTKPKGVQLTNANVTSAFAPLDVGVPSPWTSMNPADVVLCILPHGHVAGAGAGLAGLYAGSTLVVFKDFNPVTLVQAIKSVGITVLMMVPMMIRALVAALPKGSRDCQSLRLVIYGAAPMATESLLQAMAAFPQAEFGQVYGLTETNGPITYLSPSDHREIAAGNIHLTLSCGRPLPDTEVKVVDNDGVELPRSEVGEVVGRGPQVMKGYWNRNEDSAAILRNGWLYSGDLGYMDEKGYVFLHDRKKDMIVSGGENVYPAEVENALFNYPAVAEAAVFGVPDLKWGEAVKAAVVLKSGAITSEAEILTFLKELIAGYKVPKSIDFVEALPRNATGKVLRRHLREPYWANQSRQVG